MLLNCSTVKIIYVKFGGKRRIFFNSNHVLLLNILPSSHF